jgi:hypothetical protein
MILAQGLGDNDFSLWGMSLGGSFHLETSEFIAVVTTTTATVFGFLVIVARHVFNGSGD